MIRAGIYSILAVKIVVFTLCLVIGFGGDWSCFAVFCLCWAGAFGLAILDGSIGIADEAEWH